MFDVIVGLTILSLLLVIVAKAASWHARTQQHLADSNTALAAAERTLLELHEGIEPRAGDGSATVHVEQLTDGELIAGFRWVRVTTVCNQRSASLTGLEKLTAREKP
jgi:hypothetical protein